jgi:hypothetical protein
MKQGKKVIDICWNCPRESNSHWVTIIGLRIQVRNTTCILHTYSSIVKILKNQIWHYSCWYFKINKYSPYKSQTSVADMVSHMGQIWGHYLTLKNSVEVKVGFYSHFNPLFWFLKSYNSRTKTVLTFFEKKFIPCFGPLFLIFPDAQLVLSQLILNISWLYY